MRCDWDRVKHPSVKQAAFSLCLRLLETYNESIAGMEIAPIPVKNSELMQMLGLEILQLVDDVLECLPHKPENLREIVRDFVANHKVAMVAPHHVVHAIRDGFLEYLRNNDVGNGSYDLWPRMINLIVQMSIQNFLSV